MQVEKRDGITILVTGHRLDAINGARVKEAVKELAQEPGLRLVLDMEKTLFMDSSGCGQLLSMLRALTINHGYLKFARPTPQVLGMFELTRLNKVFEIYDSVESAVESFKHSHPHQTDDAYLESFE